LLDRIANQDLVPLSVDLTTPDIVQTGLSVVRVLIPGLVLNGPPAFPFLGSDRLQAVPSQLGWRTVHDHRVVPLPYA